MPSLPPVPPVDACFAKTLRARLDAKTKPPGSLGRLEDLAVQVALAQHTGTPAITRPAIIVCAGDHGVVAEGVSAWPQSVTAEMVKNMLAGGAAINAIAGALGVQVSAVDCGVAGDLTGLAGLVDRKVAHGTGNLAHEPAMSMARCDRALMAGVALAECGGFEIATMAGAMVGAASCRVPVLVDGFIASAAALVARALATNLDPYLVWTHRSAERGHARLLKSLGVSPLLDLEMRLGEGTGGAVALPLLRAAVATLNDMASFEEAGVSGQA